MGIKIVKYYGIWLQQICNEHNVLYGGVEIAVQQTVFDKDDYHVNISVLGAGTSDDILDGKGIREGDILLGVMNSGLESTCFPLIKVMENKRGGLLNETLKSGKKLIDEMMRPSCCYAVLLKELHDNRLIEEASFVGNSILHEMCYRRIPDEFCVNIDLSKIPVTPLYQYIFNLGFISEENFPKRFPLGVGLLMVVHSENYERVCKIANKNFECVQIGKIEKRSEYYCEKVEVYGKLKIE